MSIKTNLCTLLVAAALAVAPLSVRADSPKVVLELFTSQGCSSCPSADSLLGELAEARDDVVALSFHVDYWDYIGWEDRFATSETTERQRDYARALGIAYVYTPQLVIDGSRHVVGSNRHAVKDAIDVSKAAKARRAPVALTSGGPGRLRSRSATRMATTGTPRSGSSPSIASTRRRSMPARTGGAR